MWQKYVFDNLQPRRSSRAVNFAKYWNWNMIWWNEIHSRSDIILKKSPGARILTDKIYDDCLSAKQNTALQMSIIPSQYTFELKCKSNIKKKKINTWIHSYQHDQISNLNSICTIFIGNTSRVKSWFQTFAMFVA